MKAPGYALSALTIVALALSTTASDARSTRRNTPVLDHDSRLIVGSEVYTPAKNMHREGRPHGVAPAAASEPTQSPDAQPARKKDERPAVAECVAGCG